MAYQQEAQETLATLSPAEFLGYVEFLAEHDLLGEAREALAKADVTAIRINPEPLVVVRGVIEELLRTDRLSAGGRAGATKIVEECGCSVLEGCNPSGCSTDAGTEAGTEAGTPGPSPTLPMEPGSSVHVP